MPPHAPLSRDQHVGYLNWWLEAWNRVFNELVDPASHVVGGWLEPGVMIGRLAATQRLIACLQQVLVDTAVDEFGRLIMFLGWRTWMSSIWNANFLRTSHRLSYLVLELGPPRSQTCAPVSGQPEPRDGPGKGSTTSLWDSCAHCGTLGTV
jgi:hypothetical protein